MRIPLLILVAIITFAVIFLWTNPDLVKQFWLWAVGLAGVIVELFLKLWELLKNIFSKTTVMPGGNKAEPKKATK